MNESIAIASVVVPVLLAMVLLLLGIIGFFIARYMRSIDFKMNALDRIEKELEGVKVKVDNNADTTTELCERLQAVESHVNNTERIAVMERTLQVLEEEVKQLRNWRHDENGRRHEAGLAAAVHAAHP